MNWQDIRDAYPNQWLVIEATDAETTLDNRRILKRIAAVERCISGDAAFQSYRRLHQQHPNREFYFVHTSRAALEIYERNWVGIRRSDAVAVAR